MQKNKKTKKSGVAALALAGALLITGAFAFLSDSDTAVNRFTFNDKDGNQTIDVRVEEPNWNIEDGKDILPLDTVTKDPTVYNDGENDVYAFVTVLVPTAKSIVLNKDDGTKYTAENVELFAYEVNEGWAEVSDTAKSIAGDDISALERTEGLELMTVGQGAITNLAEALGEDNIYYTAHTYAYTSGGEMTKIESEGNTSTLFDEVTMINIADGEPVPMTLQEVSDSLVLEEGSVKAIVGNDIVITAGEGEEATSVTAYSLVDGKVIDNKTGYAMMKAVSQFKDTDNINLYVTAYAVQADNLTEDAPDAVWAIAANTAAGTASGDTVDYSFMFKPLNEDMGHKGATSAD